MQAFTLDTSGYVPMGSEHTVRAGRDCAGINFVWSDLGPFEQGYIEALLRTAAEKLASLASGRLLPQDFAQFRRLAPETLAAILKDCAAFQSPALNEHNGRQLWEHRQAGRRADFSPLTAYLGDDGKVYLRESS